MPATPPSPTDARMNESAAPSRKAVILGPGEGRSYPMGRIAAVFKADEFESESRYSISEWWLEPHTQGPGPHSHPEDDIFYVIEGTMSVLVGEAWTHATRGFLHSRPRWRHPRLRKPHRHTSRSAQPVDTGF